MQGLDEVLPEIPVSPYELEKIQQGKLFVYETNQELILGMDKDGFVNAMLEKQKKMDLSQERHILSITFNEHTQSYECSLHPVSSLYGVVKYAA